MPPNARAEAIPEGDGLVGTLGGDWRITQPLPSWRKVRGSQQPCAVRIRAVGLERWDSSLVRFVYEVQDWCRGANATCDASALPETVPRAPLTVWSPALVGAQVASMQLPPLTVKVVWLVWSPRLLS